MLYLLTVADSMATGPKAWNDWTATLLNDFFIKVSNFLQKGKSGIRAALEASENKKKAVFAKHCKDEAQQVEPYFEVMSLRYLTFVSAADIPKHIELAKQLDEKGLILDIKKDLSSNTRIVTVCTKNKPGLFAQIAGVFALNGHDILDAQIHTWKNDVVLDTFRVTPPLDQIFEEEHWEKLKKEMGEVLAYNINLSVRLLEKFAQIKSERYTPQEPPQINVDNDTSEYFTIIEVFTHDFPGLLYFITDALLKCGLDIYVAKIATKVDRVVDIFYVRNFFGEKANSAEQLGQIKSAIKKVIFQTIKGHHEKVISIYEGGMDEENRSNYQAFQVR